MRFFVYRPSRNSQDRFLSLIDSIQLASIAWAHITPKENHLRKMKHCFFLKALVCVEYEQHELSRDSAIQSKLTYIVNPFFLDGFALDEPPNEEPFLVVYLGALVPQKGFHRLARVWPKVVEQLPEAQLAVIGSGSLYDHSQVMGKYGIAEQEYEKLIVGYLSDENGVLDSSVNFLGKLGIEKKQWLYKAAIGIANPTGHTENCPGSALEFQACSTPIVSGSYYGLLDTVVDKKTGLLSVSDSEFIKHIIELLTNHEKRWSYGRNAKEFIREKYCCEKVCEAWNKLFNDILNQKKLYKPARKKTLFKHYKGLIYLNSFFQMVFGKYIQWPSVTELKTILYPKIKLLLKK